MKNFMLQTNRFDRLLRWQRIMVLMLMVLFSAIILVLTAEAVVRIRAKLRHGFWGIEQTYMIDQATGLRIPVPGGHYGPIVINSYGFRSPEIPVDKPKDGLRVAFIGSSTTYCAEVSSNEMTWPHLVWKALHEHWPTVAIDYINAAVPGYTTRSDLLTLQKRVAQFQPDIIVIYEAPNDLSGNSYKLAYEQGIVRKSQEADLGWLPRHFLLAYLIEKNLEIRRQQQLALVKSNKINLDTAKLDVEFRQDYEKLVEASQQVAKLVVTITFSPRIRQEQSPEERTKAAVTSLYYMPYMTLDDLLTGFAHYNQVIREVAKAHGTLLVGNEDAIPADEQHYTDSVHFTDAGSASMAQRVTSTMIQSSAVHRLTITGPSYLNGHPTQPDALAK